MAPENPRFCAQPPEARVELQGRREKYLAVRHSTQGIRATSQASHNRAIPRGHDYYPSSHNRMGAALHDPAGMRSATKLAGTKAAPKKLDEGVRIARQRS